MTNAVESKTTGPEESALSARTDKPDVKRRGPWRSLLAVLGVAGIMGGVGIYQEGQESRDVDVEEAREIGDRNTYVALSLGRAGFTNVIAVETSESGQSEATLSLDPTNPSACRITFYVNPNATALSLTQVDAAGREFSTVTATNGIDAQRVMADLCT